MRPSSARADDARHANVAGLGVDGNMLDATGWCRAWSSFSVDDKPVVVNIDAGGLYTPLRRPEDAGSRLPPLG
jgi:hypothetical protein